MANINFILRHILHMLHGISALILSSALKHGPEKGSYLMCLIEWRQSFVFTPSGKQICLYLRNTKMARPGAFLLVSDMDAATKCRLVKQRESPAF